MNTLRINTDVSQNTCQRLNTDTFYELWYASCLLKQRKTKINVCAYMCAVITYIQTHTHLHRHIPTHTQLPVNCKAGHKV